MPIVVSNSTTNPAPVTDATSTDLRVRAVTDIIWDGVLIKVDFSGLPMANYAIPFTCNIYRLNADGTEDLVRSGNPARSYDMVCWAYDHEAPLGRACSYRAVPVMADGSDGPSTFPASVYVTQPQGTYKDPGVWGKCLDDPGKSMRLRMVRWGGGSLPGNLTTNRVWNNPFKAITPDVRGGREFQCQVLTLDQDEYDQLEDLINAGPIYLQNRSGRVRRDSYVTIDNVDFDRPGHMANAPEVIWTLNCIEQDRPDPYGQFIRVPGKSFADRQLHYPLFSDTLVDGHKYRDNMLAT